MKVKTLKIPWIKTADVGQAHAGVEGAGDVEPEQRPLLLRDPLSGPCQKQRFCSPGNISSSCLCQILLKRLKILSPNFLFSGHGYRRQVSLTSSTTGVYRSSRRWDLILHLNIARWEMFTQYFYVKDQFNYWWVWNLWKCWLSETVCISQRSPSLGPSQKGFHQRNILPYWWAIKGFMFVICLDLFFEKLTKQL